MEKRREITIACRSGSGSEALGLKNRQNEAENEENDRKSTERSPRERHRFFLSISRAFLLSLQWRSGQEKDEERGGDRRKP